MLNMSISEGKICALRMPVGRNVPPNAPITPRACGRHAEGGVVDLVFVHIQKNEKLRGIGVSYFSKLSEAGVHPGIRIQFRQPIDAKAHIVTSPPELIQVIT